MFVWYFGFDIHDMILHGGTRLLVSGANKIDDGVIRILLEILYGQDFHERVIILIVFLLDQKLLEVGVYCCCFYIVVYLSLL